jgi:hypothetical protein
MTMMMKILLLMIDTADAAVADSVSNFLHAIVVRWWLNADGIDSMCRLRGCLFVGSQSDMWKCNPGCFLDL